MSEAETLVRVDPSRCLVLSDDVLAAEEGTTEERALAWFLRARALFVLRRLPECSEASLEARRLFGHEGDESGYARATVMVANVLSALGHLDGAVDLLTEAIEAADGVDPVGLASAEARSSLGAAYRRAGELDQAIVAFRDAVRVARAQNDATTLASALLNAASAVWQTGALDEAAALLAESRAIVEGERLHGLEAWQEALDAWVAVAAGRHADGRRHAESAIALSDAIGERDSMSSAVRALARALSTASEVSASDIDRARTLLVSVLEEARAKSWNADAVVIAQELSELEERAEDPRAALEWMRLASQAERAVANEGRVRMREAELSRLSLQRVEIENAQNLLRVRALDELNQKLVQLDAERTRLLATVAHDLRSPLTAIRIAIDTMVKTGGGNRELLTMIDGSAQQMMAVIDEALSIDAVRAGRVTLRLRDVDVCDAVARSIAALTPLAREKGIALDVMCKDRMVAHTDAPALARIVDNVVGNALKFSPHGSRVVVTLAREGERVVIEVLDEGPGFDADELDEIGAFRRRGAAEPTNEEASDGIGLHVVFDLARALGLDVSLSNRSSGGACVRIAIAERAAP